MKGLHCGGACMVDGNKVKERVEEMITRTGEKKKKKKSRCSFKERKIKGL